MLFANIFTKLSLHKKPKNYRASNETCLRRSGKYKHKAFWVKICPRPSNVSGTLSQSSSLMMEAIQTTQCVEMEENAKAYHDLSQLQDKVGYLFTSELSLSKGAKVDGMWYRECH